MSTSILAAWRFAFWLVEEFLALNLVAAAVYWRNEVIFAEEIYEHMEVFVVHDDDLILVVSHELELHFVGVIEELFLSHFANLDTLKLLDEWLLILKESIKRQALWEAKLVGLFELLCLLLRNELLLVVKLEEFFKLALVKDNNRAVDNRGFIAFWDLDSEVGRERLEAFAVELPAELALQCGASGKVLCDIESLLAIITRVAELRDNALNALKLVLLVSEVINVLVFVLDEIGRAFRRGRLFRDRCDK